MEYQLLCGYVCVYALADSSDTSCSFMSIYVSVSVGVEGWERFAVCDVKKRYVIFLL